MAIVLSEKHTKALRPFMEKFSRHIKTQEFRHDQEGRARRVEYFKTELPSKPPVSEPFDHDEIRDLVKFVGMSLGFDASSEVPVAHGATVDVVWRARIGNLAVVTYVFEVHKAGSIDSLILNL